MAQALSLAPFDRARPLWEFTLVEGLPGDRAAFVQKVHHTVTDGVGGVRLALMLVDEHAVQGSRCRCIQFRWVKSLFPSRAGNATKMSGRNPQNMPWIGWEGPSAHLARETSLFGKPSVETRQRPKKPSTSLL